MKIPKDLTHLPFGLRDLTAAEASTAISFIWRGQDLPWLILDTRSAEIVVGTNPRIGGRWLTLSVDGEDRRFPCPTMNCGMPTLHYKFSIVRSQHEERHAV